MPQQPTARDLHFMKLHGFKTREEYVDWMNQPCDPVILERLEAVYPDDYPDLESDDPFILPPLT